MMMTDREKLNLLSKIVAHQMIIVSYFGPVMMLTLTEEEKEEVLISVGELKRLMQHLKDDEKAKEIGTFVV